ncbi:MAG: Ig-like domain-containing protein [Prolixibacteraceae bacterium]
MNANYSYSDRSLPFSHFHKRIQQFLFLGLFCSLQFLTEPAFSKTSYADSLLLAELYINTGGPQGLWKNDWPYNRDQKIFTSDPAEWYGISVNAAGFVTEINLQNNGLEGSFETEVQAPVGFTFLSRLRILNVSHNTQLINFLTPWFLNYLTPAREIYVAGTQVSGSIPAAIGNLNNLLIFDISSTAINQIPNEIANLTNLHTLNLSSNEFTIFPSALFKLTGIEALYLNDNKIKQIPPAFTASAASANINIENNYLDFCDLTNLKNGFPFANLEIAPQYPEEGILAQNVYVDLNENLPFNVSLCGSNNVYQWEKAKDGVWNTIPDETDSSLTLFNVNIDDNGLYRCQITNTNFNNLSLYSANYQVIVNPDLAPDFTINLLEDHVKEFLLQDYYNENQLNAFQLLISKSIPLTFQATTSPHAGNFTVVNFDSYSFKYTPNKDFYGFDSISYRLFNTTEKLNFEGQILFKIDPMNDAPTLLLANVGGSNPTAELLLDVQYGSSVSFEPIMSDISDGSLACNLTLKKVAALFDGKISYNATTNLAKYTPVKNVEGTEIVTLIAQELCDQALNSKVRVLKVNIIPKIENEVPIAKNTEIHVEQFETIAFDLPAFDEESSGEQLKVKILQEPQHALFFVVENGQVFYQSETFFSGLDSIQFMVSDEEGANSTIATILFHVTQPPINQMDSMSEVLQITVNGTEFGKLEKDTIEWFTFQQSWFISDSWDYPDYKLANVSYLNNSETKKYFEIENGYPESRIRLSRQIIQHFLFFYNAKNFIAPLNNFYQSISVNTTINRFQTAEVLAERPLSLQVEVPEITTIALTQHASISTIIDTITMVTGSTDTILFSAAGLTGALQFEILQPPVTGTLTNFQFLSHEANLITFYKGIYHADDLSVGFDSIVYRVSDGNQSRVGMTYIKFTPKKSELILSAVNQQIMNEDDSLNVSIEASYDDRPIQNLFFKCSISSTSNEFRTSLNKNQLSIHPPENFNGFANVHIDAFDSVLNYTSIDFKLEVLQVNDLPSIMIDGETELVAGNQIDVVVSASDIENETVQITLSNLPTWLVQKQLFGGFISLTGKAKLSDAGITTITIQASDGHASSSRNIDFNIKEYIDLPPVVAQEIVPVNLPKASPPISIDLSKLFSDPNEDSISLSISDNTNAAWLKINIDGSMLLVEILDQNNTGYATITLQATANQLTTSYALVIYTLDKPPLVTQALQDISVWKNNPPVNIRLNEVFSDPDGDKLMLSIDSISRPEMILATIEQDYLNLSFQQDAGGTCIIYLKASAFGHSIISPLVINIKDAPPVLNVPINDTIILKNSAPLILGLDKLFTDPDDAFVSISISNISNFDLIKSSEIVTQDTLKIDINKNVSGMAEITLTANSQDKSLDFSFTILVEDQAPEIVVPLPEISMEFIEEPRIIDLSYHISDPDNDLLTFRIIDEQPKLVKAEIIGKFLRIQYNTEQELHIGKQQLQIEASADQNAIIALINITMRDTTLSITLPIDDLEVFKNQTPVKIDLITLFDDASVVLKMAGFSNSELITTANIVDNRFLMIHLAQHIAGEAQIIITGFKNGRSTDNTFTITVIDRAPVINKTIAPVEFNNNASPVTLDLSTYFSDPDQEPLTFKVTSNTNPELITTQIDDDVLSISYKAINQLKSGSGYLDVSAEADGKDVQQTIFVTVTDPTSIFEYKTHQFKLYPNPAGNRFYIELDPEELSELFCISLINFSGQKFSLHEKDYTLNYDRIVVQTKNIIRNTYLVKIETIHNSYSKLIVIE